MGQERPNLLTVAYNYSTTRRHGGGAEHWILFHLFQLQEAAQQVSRGSGKLSSPFLSVSLHLHATLHLSTPPKIESTKLTINAHTHTHIYLHTYIHIHTPAGYFTGRGSRAKCGANFYICPTVAARTRYLQRQRQRRKPASLRKRQRRSVSRMKRLQSSQRGGDSQCCL